VPIRAGRDLTQARGLLAAGAVGAPLFVLAFFLEGAFRPGYHPARDMVSALDLSSDGWQQIANFLVAGALILAFAAGVRGAVPAGRASRWGPRLLALTGAGLMVSGIFMPDATRGYPAGAPAGPAPGSSWHNTLHGLGALVWVVSVSLAGFVFARYFLAARRPLLAGYSIASGVVVLVSFLVSFSGSSQTSGFLASHGGLVERVAGVAAMAWVTVLALHLLPRAATRVPGSGPVTSRRSRLPRAQRGRAG
jgi:Protein of unknown function (DUF998)